jgi:DNA replication protein DnaC
LACAPAQVEKIYQRAVEDVEGFLRTITPPRYQATDTMHPDFNRRLWERVQTWKPTSERPWLGMTGPTGESKTRCAFLTFRKINLEMIRRPEYPEDGAWRPSVAVVSAYQFSEAVLGQFQDEQKASSVELLRKLRRVQLLMIDDLGKQRNTPAISGELFAMLDHRHAENLCTIWTSNSTPEGIVSGMSEDMAGPLAGRIRECSTIINLS